MEYLSVVAILLSMFSIYWSQQAANKYLYQAKLNRNLSLMYDLKIRLGKLPDAFRFYGLSDEEIRIYRLEPKELSYLVCNFIAGQIYWESEITNNNSFSDSDYRARLCQSAEVQKAWSLISRLIDNTSYKEHIDGLIRKYQGMVS